MEDYLKLNVAKDVIEGILVRHNGKNFVQCGKCGSINSDAKELAMTLYAIGLEVLHSEEESLLEIYESCSELLRQIIVIGMPGECYKDYDLCTKWFAENEQRLLPELNDDFGDEVFIKSHDVVLKVDYVCGCFPLAKGHQGH